MWGPITREQAVAKYGAPQNGGWPGALQNCILFKVPSDIMPSWVNSVTRKPTDRIYCNKDMVVPLLSALGNVRNAGLIPQLKTFDGCFMQRDVRGVPGVISWHFYAMAIDINAATNELGTVGDMSSAMVACFRDAGFIWGGSFERKDFMHFQLGLD